MQAKLREVDGWRYDFVRGMFAELGSEVAEFEERTRLFIISESRQYSVSFPEEFRLASDSLDIRPALYTAPLTLPAPGEVGADEAEMRFCHYQGLVYSRDAYIQVGGSSTVVHAITGCQSATGGRGGALNSGGQVSSQTEQMLIRCVPGNDGVLGWSPVATLQIGN